MFFVGEEEEAVDFINLDEVREGWNKSDSQPGISPNIDANADEKPTRVRWELEVPKRFEKLRETLVTHFPDYVPTFDVLFEGLEQDMAAWLGLELKQEQEAEQPVFDELEDALESPDFEDSEPVDESPDKDPAEAAKAFEQGLMELENFLEAVFVDGDFWRLMR